MSDSLFHRHKPDILDCIANLSNDEVFTPPAVVNKMLDLLPPEVWTNPNLRFLDPGCKSGVFLREAAKRLMAGLARTCLVRPACFPPDPSLVEFVQRQIRHTWPRLASPAEYAEVCANLERDLAQVEEKNGTDKIIAGLRTRCAEVAQSLRGRTLFAIDSGSGAFP